jgi:hypothetical protein
MFAGQHEYAEQAVLNALLSHHDPGNSPRQSLSKKLCRRSLTASLSPLSWHVQRLVRRVRFAAYIAAHATRKLASY